MLTFQEGLIRHELPTSEATWNQNTQSLAQTLCIDFVCSTNFQFSKYLLISVKCMDYELIDESCAAIAVNDENHNSECRGQAATGSFEITTIAATWID